MRRADGRYRGRRPRNGLTPEQMILLFLVALVAVLALTIRANSIWTGQSCGEQIHQALFVTKDWD